MNDVFNRSFYKEESNIYVDDMSEFKINSATLLKVKNGVITESYEGKENIVKQFEDMID